MPVLFKDLSVTLTFTPLGLKHKPVYPLINYLEGLGGIHVQQVTDSTFKAEVTLEDYPKFSAAIGNSLWLTVCPDDIPKFFREYTKRELGLDA